MPLMLTGWPLAKHLSGNFKRKTYGCITTKTATYNLAMQSKVTATIHHAKARVLVRWFIALTLPMALD